MCLIPLCHPVPQRDVHLSEVGVELECPDLVAPRKLWDVKNKLDLGTKQKYNCCHGNCLQMHEETNYFH